MADMKFEQALNKLEKIVEDMETGDLTLEDSLKKYEEGMKLSRLCSKKLKEAEKKIEILIRDSEGELKAEPFDKEHLPAENSGKPNKSKKIHKPAEEEDEDLLF